MCDGVCYKSSKALDECQLCEIIAKRKKGGGRQEKANVCRDAWEQEDAVLETCTNPCSSVVFLFVLGHHCEKNAEGKRERKKRRSSGCRSLDPARFPSFAQAVASLTALRAYRVACVVCLVGLALPIVNIRLTPGCNN